MENLVFNVCLDYSPLRDVCYHYVDAVNHCDDDYCALPSIISKRFSSHLQWFVYRFAGLSYSLYLDCRLRSYDGDGVSLRTLRVCYNMRLGCFEIWDCDELVKRYSSSSTSVFVAKDLASDIVDSMFSLLVAKDYDMIVIYAFTDCDKL